MGVNQNPIKSLGKEINCGCMDAEKFGGNIAELNVYTKRDTII